MRHVHFLCQSGKREGEPIRKTVEVSVVEKEDLEVMGVVKVAEVGVVVKVEEDTIQAVEMEREEETEGSRRGREVEDEESSGVLKKMSTVLVDSKDLYPLPV